jgi:hypothetical protein
MVKKNVRTSIFVCIYYVFTQFSWNALKSILYNFVYESVYNCLFKYNFKSIFHKIVYGYTICSSPINVNTFRTLRFCGGWKYVCLMDICMYVCMVYEICVRKPKIRTKKISWNIQVREFRHFLHVKHGVFIYVSPLLNSPQQPFVTRISYLSIDTLTTDDSTRRTYISNK